MSAKKILFITAPYECWGVQVVGTWPPLHMVYLAGAAREAGFEAIIYDAMNKKHDHLKVKEKIAEIKPDYVHSMDYLPVTGAISTATVPSALKVLRAAKEVRQNITTILSGPHPTFMYKEIFDEDSDTVDVILTGESEISISEFLKSENKEDWNKLKGIVYTDEGKIIEQPKQPQIENLDELKPAWDLLDWEDYHYNVAPEGRMASILTTRGCNMGCSFCSQRMFWEKNWRARKPEKVLEEILHLRDKYKVKFFTLIDAYPSKNRVRWEHLLDLLIKEKSEAYFLIETRVEDIIRDEDILHKYKEAGIIHIYIGAESADPDNLNAMNKGTTFEQNKEALRLCRENDLITEASFMVGFLNETKESIDKTIASAIDMNPDVAVFPVVTPMPFTPLFEDMKDRIRVTDYSKYNLTTPIVEPYNMTLEEVSKNLGKCYMNFYRNKMSEVKALPEGFKKDYMMSAFKLMIRDYGEAFDFLNDHIKKHI